MKITQLEILPTQLGGRVFVYVRLHTDAGLVGVGESACSNWLTRTRKPTRA